MTKVCLSQWIAEPDSGKNTAPSWLTYWHPSVQAVDWSILWPWQGILVCLPGWTSYSLTAHLRAIFMVLRAPVMWAA